MRAAVGAMMCLGMAACTNESAVTDCTTDADCELEGLPFCDTELGSCLAPCTRHEVGDYACVGGRRVECSYDRELPCAACPSICGSWGYCDAGTMACVPRKSSGAPCADPGECSSSSCLDGFCGVSQGESCTAATCDGVCAMGRDGQTYCVRDCSVPGCGASTAGGLSWTCVRLGWDTTAPSYCVPLEECLWQASCGTFSDATCGMSCPAEGACVTYCVPNGLPVE